MNTGRTYFKDGYVERWRDPRQAWADQGAICFNIHVGDAWELGNTGEYPEKFLGLAKAKAGALWCKHATEATGESWGYLLIPHDQVRLAMTLSGFIAGCTWQAA